MYMYIQNRDILYAHTVDSWCHSMFDHKGSKECGYKLDTLMA